MEIVRRQKLCVYFDREKNLGKNCNLTSDHSSPELHISNPH